MLHRRRRQNDWHCVNCQNLNYSFRKICNRCKIQTREDNENYLNFLKQIQQQIQSQPCQLHTVQSSPIFSPARSPKGFMSKLLLTPKSTDQQCPQCPHYKSPKTLPDLQPLLRKYSQS